MPLRTLDGLDDGLLQLQEGSEKGKKVRKRRKGRKEGQTGGRKEGQKGRKGWRAGRGRMGNGKGWMQNRGLYRTEGATCMARVWWCAEKRGLRTKDAV
jgi:hypothetical protein